MVMEMKKFYRYIQIFMCLNECIYIHDIDIPMHIHISVIFTYLDMQDRHIMIEI